MSWVVRDKYGRRLAAVEETSRTGVLEAKRLPAASLGEFLWVMAELEKLGFKVNEKQD